MVSGASVVDGASVVSGTSVVEVVVDVVVPGIVVDVVDVVEVVVVDAGTVEVVDVVEVVPGTGSGASPVATTLVLASGIGVCDNTSGDVSSEATVTTVVGVTEPPEPPPDGRTVEGVVRRAVVGGAATTASVDTGAAGSVIDGLVEPGDPSSSSGTVGTVGTVASPSDDVSVTPGNVINVVDLGPSASGTSDVTAGAWARSGKPWDDRQPATPRNNVAATNTTGPERMSLRSAVLADHLSPC